LGPKTITVYCSSSDSVADVYKEAARELGTLIARRGYNMIYGGSRVGLMGIVSDAAFDAGGQVLAIMPSLFQAASLPHNEAIELMITEGMRARKTLMEERADAFIALPGGFGTLEEVLEVITNRQLRLHDKPIVLLNINNYYAPLLAQFETAFESHFIRPEYRDLVHTATTPIAAMDFIATLVPPPAMGHDASGSQGS
jgi:cytokinin riboside 5'-monophosphate phosphoribohydrolase